MRRAVTARQLLENPLLQEAFAAVEGDLLAQMRNCPLSDKDGHTRLVMALQLSHAVNRHLWLTIQDGTTAAESLNVRRLD